MKLSIITINRNNASGLEKTLKSVSEQTFSDFEYIVIDGASTDDSVDIIKKYSGKITYWVSEPDSGIYNAMNKGIRKAKGYYCLFLNSGDCLIEPETLRNVFDEISGLDEAGVYYSDTLTDTNMVIAQPKPLRINDLINRSINHQNSLIKTALFFMHGGYDEKYTIYSDWLFFLKELWIYKTRFIYITTKLSIYDTHGVSSQNSGKRHAEILSVYKEVFGDLAELLISLNSYCNSIYADIVNTYGSTKFLQFFLRTYRYIIKQFYRLFTKNKKA